MARRKKTGDYNWTVEIIPTPDPERVRKGNELLCRFIAQQIIKEAGMEELLPLCEDGTDASEKSGTMQGKLK